MSARDEILGTVRRSLGAAHDDAARRATVEARIAAGAPGLRPSRGQGDVDARSATFAYEAQRVNATFERVASLDLVPGAAARFLRERILAAHLRMGEDLRLDTMPWAATQVDITRGPSAGNDLNAISFAEAAVAETGTLVFVSGPHNPTTLNFLPDNHIAVVRAADVEAKRLASLEAKRASDAAEAKRLAALESRRLAEAEAARLAAAATVTAAPAPRVWTNPPGRASLKPARPAATLVAAAPVDRTPPPSLNAGTPEVRALALPRPVDDFIAERVEYTAGRVLDAGALKTLRADFIQLVEASPDNSHHELLTPDGRPLLIHFERTVPVDPMKASLHAIGYNPSAGGVVTRAYLQPIDVNVKVMCRDVSYAFPGQERGRFAACESADGTWTMARASTTNGTPI